MSAAEALMAARTAGICVRIDGDDLLLEASAPPPAVLDLLSRHKAGLLALLRSGRAGWLAVEWQAFYDERAAIGQWDGGLPRVQAEGLAFTCCIAEWLNQNFVRSPPERCLACGGGNHAHNSLLPYGMESTGHAWLHSRCWSAWQAKRKADAVDALATMRITTPAYLPYDAAREECAAALTG